MKNQISPGRLHLLFYLTLVFGVSIFWIAPRPPLIDLPQHAGQVALMHDLATGASPWSDLFKVNLLTPYLIGYGLAFPLSFLVPVVAALKIVLSGAYVAFVLLGSRLRAHFGADERLDWLLLPAFFGFAYTWGFYTFLVSTPVLFLFVLAADRHAQAPTLGRGLLATLVGLGLLLSHGLAFVFGMLVAGCLVTVRSLAAQSARSGWLRRWLGAAWPLVLPGIACVVYYLVSVRFQAQYWAHGSLPVTWEGGIMRLPRLLINAVGDYYQPSVVLGVAALAMVAAPFLLGLRIDRRHPAVWVFLGVVLLVELVVPSTMISTAYVYQRFALFALPAYVLVFAARPARKAGEGGAQARPLAMGVMVLAVWTALGFHSHEMWKFGQEARDFDPVLQAMQPRQRVLALTYENASSAANLPQAYRHYSTWYGAEKQGLVDFNFGWFPPQIVRFRPDRLPLVKEGFKPAVFDPRKYPLDTYRYVIARHVDALPADLFRGSDCATREVASSGTWTLFEVGTCRHPATLASAAR